MDILAKYDSLNKLGKQQVDAFVDFLISREQTFTDELMSVDQYNKELDEADTEIDNGEFISHEDLKKEMDT